MKKIILFTIILIASQTTLIFAQDNDEKKVGYDPMARPNIVKVNLSSLVFKNIAIQYERILSKKISVACQVRYMPNGPVAFTKLLEESANTGDSISLSNWKAGGFAITPEFRFYPRHAGKGFYVAPYLRYRKMDIDFPVSYIDDNGKTQSLTILGKTTSFMGGLMIGSQFNLGPMITLDWFIIGGQYGVTKGDLDIKTLQALSANDQVDIKANLEEFKNSASSFNNFNYTVNANGGSISGNFGELGFRGFGLNLGFKF